MTLTQLRIPLSAQEDGKIDLQGKNMDEAIIDFLSSLEDAVRRAEIVQGVLEGGEMEASANDLETFSRTLDEQISLLQDLQSLLNSELDSAPLDFGDE